MTTITGPAAIVKAINSGETVHGWVPAVEMAGPKLDEVNIRLVPRPPSSMKGDWKTGAAEDYGAVEISEEEIAAIQARAPKPIPVSHQQRLETIVRSLVELGEASLRQRGYVEWPKSIEAEMVAMGWKAGKPHQWRDVIEPLARRFITQAANKVKEADQHRVTLEHAGRLSA